MKPSNLAFMAAAFVVLSSHALDLSGGLGIDFLIAFAIFAKEIYQLRSRRFQRTVTCYSTTCDMKTMKERTKEHNLCSRLIAKLQAELESA
jgi:hypothetical protein